MIICQELYMFITFTSSIYMVIKVCVFVTGFLVVGQHHNNKETKLLLLLLLLLLLFLLSQAYSSWQLS
jgi:hypothetical protein